MINDTKLSIIILKEDDVDLSITLGSLDKQSYKNFEILYLNNDNNERTVDNNQMFNKKSFGNLINECKGDYVLFLKSGDYLFTDSLKVILNNISTNYLDLLFFNSNFYTQEDKVDKNYYEQKLIEKEDISELIKLDCKSEDFKEDIFSNFSNIYDRLFSRKFLIDSHEKIFDKDDISELAFAIKSVLLAKKVFSLEYTLLLHKVLNIHKDFKLINEQIISANSSSLELVDTIKGIENFLFNNNLYDKYEAEFIKFKLKILTDNLDMSKFHEYVVYVPEEERTDFRNKYFDYSKYYNSNSSYVGFSEDFSNDLFNKTKEYLVKQVIFKNEVKSLINDDDFTLVFEKYESILNSDDFNEYLHSSSLSTINILKHDNEKLKLESDHLNNTLEIYDTIINENEEIKNESKQLISKRKTNIEYMDYINSKIVSSDEQLSIQNDESKNH